MRREEEEERKEQTVKERKLTNEYAIMLPPSYICVEEKTKIEK